MLNWISRSRTDRLCALHPMMMSCIHVSSVWWTIIIMYVLEKVKNCSTFLILPKIHTSWKTFARVFCIFTQQSYLHTFLLQEHFSLRMWFISQEYERLHPHYLKNHPLLQNNPSGALRLLFYHQLPPPHLNLRVKMFQMLLPCNLELLLLNVNVKETDVRRQLSEQKRLGWTRCTVETGLIFWGFHNIFIIILSWSTFGRSVNHDGNSPFLR